MPASTVIAFRCTSPNIGHHFHDDFWALYTWARVQQLAARNFTIAYLPDGCAPWSKELFKLAAQEHDWRVMVATSEQPLCASEALLLPGKDRHLTFERGSIRAIKDLLRTAALRRLRVPLLPPLEATERVVILTRLQVGRQCEDTQPTLRASHGDVATRRFCDVRPLVTLFDAERTQVEVVGPMPGEFYAQVALFASAKLLVAPNGGWNPNALWLPSDACVVEAHQYVRDSWLAFGLHLGLGELLQVVGNYSTGPRKTFMCALNATHSRPCRRIGGDDDFTAAEKLAADVQDALKRSLRCRRFLVSDPFWPSARSGECTPRVEGDSRWLARTIGPGPGLSHTLNMYLSGVARAHACGMRLIYEPITASHGLGWAFDDLLWADPRGIVAPLESPALSCLPNSSRRTVDGQDVGFTMIQPPPPVQSKLAAITAQLAAAPPRSVTWARKIDNFFARVDSRPIRDEVLYTGLWMRERFWSAVHTLAASAPTVRRLSGRRVTGAAPVLICVHLRRGDVLSTQLRSTHRFVGVPLVLSALSAVREAIRMPLALPAVHVRVFSEPGLRAQDIQLIRGVSPDAEVILDTTPSATIDALVSMSSSDILLLGGSGFSWWAGLFSCGLKLGGPRMHTPRDRLPVRHFSGIYFSDGALRPNGTESAAMERTFALAVPELREAWRAYWTCKLDRVCQQHALCAARQIDNEDWISASSLSRGLAADDSLAQWRPPPESFGWQNGSAWRALANLHVNDGGTARAGSAGWRHSASACMHQLSRQSEDRDRAAPHMSLLEVSRCTKRHVQRSLQAFLSCD